jgi:hypothetical protein
MATSMIQGPARRICSPSSEAEGGWWVSRDQRDTHIATHADRRREGEHLGGLETVGVAGSAQARAAVLRERLLEDSGVRLPTPTLHAPLDGT